MKRISQLDGVRGVAILLVLVWHYGCCQIVTEPHSATAKMVELISLSWSGVDLFFVLSGFLIAGILLDHRDSGNFFRVFYWRRVCRIFPLYYLLLGTFVYLTEKGLFKTPAYTWLFQNPYPIWAYATFNQNIFMGIRGDFGANWLNMTWSLAVEEQFYLIVPFLIYFLPRPHLIGVLVTAILAAPFLRWISPGFHAFVYTPWRSDSLLSGALLAVLVRNMSFVAIVRKNLKVVFTLFCTLLAGAAVLTIYPHCLGPLNHFWLAGLYADFILVAVLHASTQFDRILSPRILIWSGELSYGIYMLHQPISGLVHGYFRHAAPVIASAPDAAATAGALVITVLIAALSFRYFERPLLQLGHRAQYLPKPIAVTFAADASSIG